jgi:crossover junction endodeoxyribonuclease RuvC
MVKEVQISSIGPTIKWIKILNCLASFGYLFKIKTPLHNNSKIILGIDPGTVIMGYGVIEAKDKKLTLLETDVIKLGNIKNIFERLYVIQKNISSVIQKFSPTEFAIEAPFFGKNVQSMLKLGRAQGVAIAAGFAAGLSVHEYSPKKVKQSITGNGNADKEQVWKMLQHYLAFVDKPKYYDATDAIAVAICHYFESTHSVKAGTKKNSWEAFIKNSPDRIRKR